MGIHLNSNSITTIIYLLTLTCGEKSTVWMHLYTSLIAMLKISILYRLGISQSGGQICHLNREHLFAKMTSLPFNYYNGINFIHLNYFSLQLKSLIKIVKESSIFPIKIYFSDYRLLLGWFQGAGLGFAW